MNTYSRKPKRAHCLAPQMGAASHPRKSILQKLVIIAVAVLLPFMGQAQCDENAVINSDFANGLSSYVKTTQWTLQGSGTTAFVRTSPTESSSTTGHLHTNWTAANVTIGGYTTVSFKVRMHPITSGVSAGTLKVYVAKNGTTADGTKVVELTVSSNNIVTVQPKNSSSLVGTPATHTASAATWQTITVQYPNSTPGTTHRLSFKAESESGSTRTMDVDDISITKECNAPLTPFACQENKSYILRNSGTSAADGKTYLYAFDIRTATYEQISNQLIPGSTNTTVIAGGYNTDDNFIWAARSGTNQIVKIGSNGQTQIFTVSGLPAQNWTAGDVDGNGVLFLHAGSSSTMYKVSLATANPTYMGTLSFSSISSLDNFVVNQAGTIIYSHRGSSASQYISKITGANTSSGSVSTYNLALAWDLGTQGALANTTSNLFLDETNGKLYMQQKNTTSNVGYQIFQMDLSDFSGGSSSTARLARLVSQGEPTALLSDGIHCPNAPLFHLTTAQLQFYPCESGISYLFQHPTYDANDPRGTAYQYFHSPTQSYRLDLQAGTIDTAKSKIIPGSHFAGTNAWGYNPADGYMWGFRKGTNQLIRVGRDWSVEMVLIPGLENLSNGYINYNGADIDENGIMYIYRGGTTTSLNAPPLNYIRRVDLNPTSSNYLQVSDLNFTYGSGVSLSTLNVIDWGYNPIDGNLYGVNTLNQLMKISRTTGLVSIVGATSITGTRAYGAVYFDVAGTLFLSENNTGEIYQIPNVALGSSTATLVILGPITSSNDGARCANSPIFTARISGKIWNDADGNALQNGSEEYFNTGDDYENGVWVNLVNASGQVVSSVPAGLDGAYTLYTGTTGTFRIIITAMQREPGTTLNAAIINSEWKFTGINNNNLTNVNTTNTTGRRNNIVVSSLGDVLGDYNFGIQQRPEADAYTFNLTVAPNSGQTIVLNSSWPVAGSTQLTELTGDDREDGSIAGDGTSNVIITTVPVATGGIPVGGVPELWYNGTIVTAGQVITNYDADLLELRVKGTNYTGFSFTYQTVDAAGAASLPASYAANWPGFPLPVSELSFTVSRQSTKVLLQWTSMKEQNNKGYEIERSNNGNVWSNIGYVNSKAENGSSSRKLDYNFTDNTPENGQNFYRLKQVDIDGKSEYSVVRLVVFDGNSNIIVYPNPAKAYVVIEGLKGSEVIFLHHITGQKIKEVSSTEGANTIQLDGLSEGQYLLRIISSDGNTVSKKIIKVK